MMELPDLERQEVEKLHGVMLFWFLFPYTKSTLHFSNSCSFWIFHVNDASSGQSSQIWDRWNTSNLMCMSLF
jgi:hypothetical protein